MILLISADGQTLSSRKIALSLASCNHSIELQLFGYSPSEHAERVPENWWQPPLHEPSETSHSGTESAEHCIKSNAAKNE